MKENSQLATERTIKAERFFDLISDLREEIGDALRQKMITINCNLTTSMQNLDQTLNWFARGFEKISENDVEILIQHTRELFQNALMANQTPKAA